MYRQIATLKPTGKLGRVYIRKDFWNCYERQKKNWPIVERHVICNVPTNNCGTHFGSSSFLVSKVANSELYDFRTTTFVRAVFSNCLFSVEHVYQCTYFSTVAPCERRNTTTWSWPLRQARWSGVIPLLFCKFIMRMFLPTKRLSTIASQPNLKQNKWTVDKKSYCAKTKQVNHVFLFYFQVTK